jgi:NAD dependent epimerase/dehydratase family enzyme
MGEMGHELLLVSARVLPAKLNAAGYKFRYANLPDALAAALR